MPLFNHVTFGDVQSHVYLEGKILKVYLEDAAIAEAKWDTADVEYENKKIFLNAAIRYHCTPVGIERANGAVADGGRGFDVDDKVILMAKIGSTPGKGEEYEQVCVVAHRDGVVKCTYNYVLIRMSADDLIPHAPPYGVLHGQVYTPTDPGSHDHEYCTVWDAMRGTPAKIYNPTTGLPYVFPVTVEEFKPALDYYKFVDEELFLLLPQGDEQSEEAGFVPNWTTDIQGDLIRNGAAPVSWWDSYDFFGNPTFYMFWKIQTALATDTVGVSSGSFTKALAVLAEYKDKIDAWKAASPGAFNDDLREFNVKGSASTKIMPPETVARLQFLQNLIGELNDKISVLDSAKISRWETLSERVANGESISAEAQTEWVGLAALAAIIKYRQYKASRITAQNEVDYILGQATFTPWEYAHDKNLTLLKGKSYHLQTEYGEDEIWVCAKNTHMGLVISSCDALWKFVRLQFLPPTLPIGNPAADRLASGRAFMGGLAFGTVASLGDITQMMASETMIRDDNNIWSYATLKRLNDGGFHHTTHPALRNMGVGSYRMKQQQIPGSPLELTFVTALNSRHDVIDVWSRYDNWMNTIYASFASWGVDRTWWFKSYAQQWRMNSLFVDTPIGSMMYDSPVWEVALWSMNGFHVWDGGPVCRRDAPLNVRFTRQTKHSKRVTVQLYIGQRQGITMWDDPSRTFVKQIPNTGIFDHFDPKMIKFVDGDGDGKNDDDYYALEEEKQAALLSDRVYVRSEYPGEVGYTPPLSFRNNRNEFEIMAACDLYSSLKTKFGRMHPNDQARNGLLEYEIEKLATLYHSGEGLGPKEFARFNIEVRIV